MPRTILIVEDYEDTRLCMKFILESYGYEVDEAADGLEAIKSIKHHLPNLILMDISMPVMDGLTATKNIRKFKQERNSIIAVTAHEWIFMERQLSRCNV